MFHRNQDSSRRQTSHRNAGFMSNIIHRNRRPTLRLPPDILAMIFELLIYTYRLPTGGYSSMGWLVIMRVCREWRGTAEELKWIWRYIDITFPRSATYILDRSRYIQGPPPNVVAQLNDPRRFQYIQTMVQKLRQYPSVGGFEVRVSGDLTQYGGFVFPPLVFTPHPEFLHRLLSIKIAFSQCHGVPRIQPVRTLLSMLAAAPSLRNLHLENCFGDNDRQEILSVPVNLPYLSKLFIESNNTHLCGYFLNFLTLPSSASIEVHSVFRNDLKIETNRMLGYLARFVPCSAPGRPVIHSLKYWDADDRAEFTVETWGAAAGLPRLKYKGSVDYGGEGSSGLGVLRDLMNILRPEDLRSLHMTIYPELDEKRWMWFSHLQHLSSLHVSGDRDGGLLSALSKLYFPALQHLSIENWNFAAVDRQGTTCCRQLVACLKNRRAHRTPLRSLSLVKCRLLSARDVHGLAKEVRVTWDGIVNMEVDDESDSDDSDDY